MRVEIILLICFFTLIGVAVYALYSIQGEGVECIANPLVYGAREVSDNYRSSLTCSCFLNRSDINSFVLTPDGVTSHSSMAPQKDVPKLPANFSFG